MSVSIKDMDKWDAFEHGHSNRWGVWAVLDNNSNMLIKSFTEESDAIDFVFRTFNFVIF